MAEGGSVTTAGGPSIVKQISNAIIGTQDVASSGQQQQQQSVDSLTLGQLKQITSQQARSKQTEYSFRYDDSDTLMVELEEFFSYLEVKRVSEGMDAFDKVFDGEWTQSAASVKTEFIERCLLDLGDLSSSTVRINAAERLSYVMQGVFAETSSPEHQLHLIIENAKLVRNLGGIKTVTNALKFASSTHEILKSHVDTQRKALGLSAQDIATESQEISQEIGLLLGLLYFLVEVFKGDDAFGDELMNLEEPLPTYLINLLGASREKDNAGYPMKRLLLLTWKVLLACLGGLRDVQRATKLAREMEGLSPIKESSIVQGKKVGFAKASPSDFRHFRQETSIKYPTFAPPIFSAGPPTEKLAEALVPLPSRRHYHASEVHDSPPQSASHPLPAGFTATPAPSPPPSPKPKKLQYQTDPTRPFVFPFSLTAHGQTGLVPFAIDEADSLYKQHIHISLGLHQMWKVREEYIRSESGLGDIDNILGVSPPNLDGEDEEDKILQYLRDKENQYRTQELFADSSGDRAALKLAREKLSALKQLERVEIIYRGVLPMLPNCVVILLKLLLATVTNNVANPTSGPVASSPPPEPPLNFDAATSGEGENLPPPTLEEIDIARHREITSKAISAVLILLLKWFKASHILKFHHLGNLLVESNCLLVILKMFGMQDISTTVRKKNDDEEHNLFRYCFIKLSKNRPASRPEDMMFDKLTIATSSTKHANPSTLNDADEEVEVVSDYSWRNFFSTINLVKIVQKLSKQKTHRILLMVQYKSSQILKRMLKVTHPMLQLQVLKVIKSQVPFCGRKWRQSNMKVITAIYLNCRPELRDEWLIASDVDMEVEESTPQEHSLRALVKYYNNKYYTQFLPPAGSTTEHRRSRSSSFPLSDDQLDEEYEESHSRSMSAGDADKFPPNRSHPPMSSHPPSYLPDSLLDDWLTEYDSVLEDVFDSTNGPWDSLYEHDEHSQSAWHYLSDILGVQDEDMSDSESVVTVGELGDDSRIADQSDGEYSVDQSFEGRNDWEHMSSQTLSAMPKSPTGTRARRRSSSGSNGSPLRPVLTFDGELDTCFNDQDEELGPAPRNGKPLDGGAVDEVEFLYGE